MSPLAFQEIPGWAAEIAGIEAADGDLPPVFPGVNTTLNRLRLARFIAEFSQDGDFQKLVYLDVLGVALGLPLTSTGSLGDHRWLARSPFRLWEYLWLYKVLELGQGNLDVLDLGGPASHLVMLSALANNRILSLALDPQIVEAANQCKKVLRLGTMELRPGDMRDLADIPNDSYDRIVCSSILGHLTVQDQQRSLGEMERILRPGGIIGLTFDYGPPAPCANPDLPSPHEPPEVPEQVIERYVRHGLHVLGNRELEAPISGSLFRDGNIHCVVGALFLGKPPLAKVSLPRPQTRDSSPLPFAPGSDLLPLLFAETMFRLETDRSLRARLLAAEAATQSMESRLAEARNRLEQLTSEVQRLREDLRGATGSLGWRAHNWLKAILPLPAGLPQSPGRADDSAPRFSHKLGKLRHHSPRPLRVRHRHPKTPANLESSLRISIVTPCLNNARFLEATILSVLGQDYPNLEYIIQDGASSDGSTFLLQRYAKMVSRFESRRDAGQANALNLGFLQATGEVMGYLNADDLLLPGALHYVASSFARRPEADVVYGHRVLIDESGHEVGRWVLPPHDDEILSWADYIPQETVFWRRRIWERAGGRIDESFQFALDWDLLLRFRSAGATFVRLPRFLAAFRVHPDQKTSQLTEIGAQEMERLRQRCHGRPVSPAEAALHTRRYLRRHLMCDLLYRLGVFRY